jgi:hypothetical protein
MVWPTYHPADPATERDQLIAANQAFAAALKKALQKGAETSARRFLSSRKPPDTGITFIV